jgi:Tfp pilus assembly protein PilW
MIFHTRHSRRRGFTLIEFIIYIALAGSLLTVIAVMLFYLIRGQAKNQVIANVEQEGNQVMSVMTQTIRNSNGIISP